MPFYSTKTYGNEQGLSACFRQPEAKSHCRFLHGYALGFSFTFGASHLDERGWVVDFGSLKPLKRWLKDTFDHRLVVGQDDPSLSTWRALEEQGLVQLTVVHGVGVERFAKLAFDFADQLVKEATCGRCWVVRCECSEHGANSGIFEVETHPRDGAFVGLR